MNLGTSTTVITDERGSWMASLPPHNASTTSSTIQFFIGDGASPAAAAAAAAADPVVQLTDVLFGDVRAPCRRSASRPSIAMTSSEESTSAKAEGYRIERALMD